MIIKIEIISQPVSGQYEERIYKNTSPWNSEYWTWIKFTYLNMSESVGQFRGFPKATILSENLNESIVITSDYVFQLDNNTGNIIEFDEHPQYQDVTLSPNGKFIFHDGYNIEKMGNSLKRMTLIPCLFEMDQIVFIKWENEKLIFTCSEIMNWKRDSIMELDSTNWIMTIKTIQK